MPAKNNKPANKPKPNAAIPGMPAEAAEAYNKIEPEILALDPENLERINVDIPRAVAIAVGAVPHLAALRGQVAQELPKFHLRSLDELGTYALAAWYTHLLALPSTTQGPLSVLLDEATPLREDMLVAAEALAHKGLLNPTFVRAIREGQGNIDKANDLVALAAVFSNQWDNVKSKTTVEWTDVERASALGPALLVALGERDQPGVQSASPDDPALRRARAYTLFVRAYDECRRAVTFLRWHKDDVDLIVPSLFATRGGRKPAEDAADPDAVTVPSPAPAGFAPAAGHAPAAGFAQPSAPGA